MKIGRHEIGAGRPTFVIAEIGVNHDGSVARAIELVEHAKAAGADAVKLQVFTADRLVHASAEFAEYQKDRTAAASPTEMLRQYELDEAALRIVADAAAAAGLELLATPFSLEDVPRVAAVASAIKIASPDLVNRLLLRRVIGTGMPMILSTGAATAEEVTNAATWLRAVTKSPAFALLHCVSNYPVDEADANLRWVRWLSQFGAPVGYSDHAMAADAGALAVACGACVIEKHLTYDTAAIGPDHSASLDPAQFADYIARIRKADRMLGRGGERRVLPCEADVRRVSRQSLVARRDLLAGHVVTEDDLTTQRPGTGCSTERFDDVLGRPLRRALRRGEMLMTEDVDL